ncbi:MAG: hypothetical protein Q8942_18265 [Bacillota bacterium]|nr:hypothetical protein [Bacillota bacterium]
MNIVINPSSTDNDNNPILAILSSSEKSIDKFNPFLTFFSFP